MKFPGKKKYNEYRNLKTRSPSSRLRDGLSFVLVICLALLLAWGIITYVFESYKVDGPSMRNTLHNNDRLIVWKAPVTLGNIEKQPWIPDRGDIIIFHQNLSSYGEPNVKTLVKRVIGLPGDRLVIKNGKVTIYNERHPDGFRPKANQLPHDNGNTPTSGNINIKLKEKQVFVMGDNRPNSLDSRVFGPIKAKQIIGKLIFRDWPITKLEVF